MMMTDRLQAAVASRLNEQRSVLDAMSGLNSVTLIVQLDRFGAGKDKVIVRTESGHRHGT